MQAGSGRTMAAYRNYHGFTIEDTGIKEEALRPCFQILCQNQREFPDASARWLGIAGKGTYYHNLFVDSPETEKLEGTDALLAFSWQNRALEPGQEETLGFVIRFITMEQQWKEHVEGLIRGRL